MGTRLNAIREACKLDPEERSEDNITDVLEFVRDVKFFAKLTALQQRTLCRTMTLEQFSARETIFEIGGLGDKFYIILSGSVSVQVYSITAPCPNKIHTSRCDCPNRPMETAVFLEKGMGFGELALQSNDPRSATILTSEVTETLVTTKADYEKYAGELHKLFIEQRVKFLRQCPLIEEALQQGAVSTQDIAAMANCLNERSLNGNELVVRQGQQVENMIFVRSGSLAMLRSVDADSSSQPLSARTPRIPKSPSGRSQSKGVGARSGSKASARGSPSPAAKKPFSDSFARDEDEGPPSAAVNMARAVINLRQQERDNQMGELFKARKQSFQEATVNTERLFGRRTSLVAVPDLHISPPSSARGGHRQTSRKLSSELSFGGSSDEASTGKPPPVAPKAVSKWMKLSSVTKEAQSVNKGVMAFMAAKEEAQEEATKEVAAPPQSARGKEKERAQDRTKKPQAPKRQLLRIGSVGAFQYFGDHQICTGEAYPCSLVSDPIAEIYMMSKHDILRRLPKKLFSALFTLETACEPTDGQLVDMLRQNERWFSYRRSMHGAAIRNNQDLRPNITSCRGVDAAANLDFLGVNLNSDLGKKTLPPPQKKGVHLTAKDEELFSQTSARFLRRYDMMKRDRGLRLALGRAGYPKHGNGLHDEDENDPMAVRFDQHWSKLRQDPVSLDLGEDLFDITMRKDYTLPSGAMPFADPINPPPELRASTSSLSSGGPASGWTATVTAELPPIIDTRHSGELPRSGTSPTLSEPGTPAVEASRPRRAVAFA